MRNEEKVFFFTFMTFMISLTTSFHIHIKKFCEILFFKDFFTLFYFICVVFNIHTRRLLSIEDKHDKNFTMTLRDVFTKVKNENLF
jgi:hypothetical protein